MELEKRIENYARQWRKRLPTLQFQIECNNNQYCLVVSEKLPNKPFVPKNGVVITRCKHKVLERGKLAKTIENAMDFSLLNEYKPFYLTKE